MKKNRYIFKIWLLIIILAQLLFAFVVGIDYVRTVWQLKLPIFARKVQGAGSALRVYKGLGYQVNVRGSFSPWGKSEGTAMFDFYLFGQRVGGAFTTGE